MPEKGSTPDSTAQPGKVLLGVTGGIAAYRSCELARLLVKGGHALRVIMTEAATKFVAPLSFATLSAHPVAVDSFGPDAWRMEHIDLARWADVLVVAPATANALWKFAGGAADDLLSTTYVAFDRDVVIAPAMNTTMWEHPAVVENRRKLEELGVAFVGPREGDLACGESGLGPMAEPADVVEAITDALARAGDLAGRQVLVTAGPTVEAIDPVRHLSNASSGLMGLELARAAARRGARVCLVHGPLPGRPCIPAGVVAVPVQSARQMRDAVMERFGATDVFIAAAAVSDYAPAERSAEKIKKQGRDRMTLELEATPDILAAAGEARRPGQVVIGFALESGDLVENARKKLQEKRADLIVANQVGEGGFPFGSAQNRVTLVGRSGEPEVMGLMSKRKVARAVIDKVRSLLDG